MSTPAPAGERYSRQLLIPEWGGEEGQARLSRADVLVVGAGGLGSPLLYYLAAAGVGTIRICDGDRVELSNLNRQILHDESRLSHNKARSAADTLGSLNSEVEITAFGERVSPENLPEMAEGVDLICCAVDDRETTRTLAEHCRGHRIPFVWGAAYSMGGFVTVLEPPGTPCVDCCLRGWERFRARSGDGAGGRLLPSGGDTGPIVGAAAGVAGSLQAMEVLKVLVGFGPVRRGDLLAFQLGGEEAGFKTFHLDPLRQPECSACGEEA